MEAGQGQEALSTSPQRGSLTRSRSRPPAAFLSAQGVHTEHTAELRGIRFTSLLQQENSDFYRLLTPALQTLASTAGAWRQGQLGRCWEGEVGLWGGQEGPNALSPPTY